MPLLFAQIPKAQKDSQLKQLFVLLESVHLKAVRKHIDEIEPWWVLFEMLCQRVTKPEQTNQVQQNNFETIERLQKIRIMIPFEMQTKS